MTPLPTITSFDEISLKGLEKSSDMLTRLDNKYVVTEGLGFTGIEALRDNFDVLTIDGKKSFGYHNVYFDDNGICFSQHKQGKRHKFKARTRLYMDSDNLAFFEVKLSGIRGQTDKFRIKCDKSDHGELRDDFQAFIERKFMEKYNKSFSYSLSPSVTTSYKRITLVAKKGGERLTIDHDVSLSVNGVEVILPKEVAIFETKSINGNGIADKILRKESIQTVSGCSKFCLAMSLSGEGGNYNKFKPLIKKYFTEEDAHTSLPSIFPTEPLEDAIDSTMQFA